jgi:hypothetical protein
MQETQNTASAAMQMITRQMAIANSAEDTRHTGAGCKRSRASPGTAARYDLIRAMYLPHTDLWRGDKAFSTLLINNRIDFCTRIVPSMPGRIAAAIAE